MKIYFATDHAGYELKEVLVSFIRDELGYDVEDLGAHGYAEDDDYTDFVSLAAEKVSQDPKNCKAIILGGSGQGEAIVANRFPRVRAIVFNGQYQPADGREIPHEIVTARRHNDANVLSLGARFLNMDEAKEAAHEWLVTPFSNDERHARRIEKIEQYPGDDYRIASDETSTKHHMLAIAVLAIAASAAATSNAFDYFVTNDLNVSSVAQVTKSIKPHQVQVEKSLVERLYAQQEVYTNEQYGLSEDYSGDEF